MAFLVHSLRTGGIERSVTRIVNGLNTKLFRPVIICLDRSGPAANWLEVDVDIIEIKKRSGNDFRAVRRLAKVLATQKADILQSHNWGTLMEGGVARRLANTPYHIHAERGTVLGVVEPAGVKHWIRAVAMGRALRRVDQVLSNSEAVAARVQQRCGYPSDKIVIVPNGVPTIAQCDAERLREQMRAQLGLQQNSTLIGSVGRLAKVKGFDIAVSAFSHLAAEMPDLQLLLVGDGPERDRLEAASVQAGMNERVHMVGRQPDVVPWLAAMDVYFNSSLSEGMSQSIVEAMSVGLPVVATEVGENVNLVKDPDSPCGLICEPNSAESLASSLRAIVKDETQQKWFGNNSRRRHASHYSSSALNDCFESLYLKTVGRR
ncbi:MAG: glycosyltransferase [Planctomycetota bacterium]|nr:glycosyltransferase [Planctomycetota bacterium]